MMSFPSCKIRFLCKFNFVRIIAVQRLQWIDRILSNNEFGLMVVMCMKICLYTLALDTSLDTVCFCVLATTEARCSS